MQTENIHIRNGRLIDPKNGIDRQADVFVAAGTICGIGEKPAGFDAARVIDASDRDVCPGLVDLSARLPSLDTDLVAAVSGGITSLACPPDTRPPLDEPELVERLVRRSEATGLARVYPIGALTRQLAGEALSELAGLARLVAAGSVRPAPTEVVPLADVAEAHRRVEGGHVRGKIVLQVHG